MAIMQALLKIKADVQGEGQVNALGRAIGGLSNTAGKVSGGLKGLAGAAGGLSGALGSLVPLATGAGLAAMAKGAIDAADDMNDLSQKTGVSVESLSKFQQAANASGTSIEGVGAAMIKLSKGMTTGKMPAIDALNELGINAKDASGKLKGTDQIMLEVADKFAKMPDGANKTALAMQLFGKAGADMIPLLNGGRQAVESLSATMTTEFAKGADSLNDKLATLQGKLLELGVKLGTALMPALNAISDIVIKVADGFSKLPKPIQDFIIAIGGIGVGFLALAPIIKPIIDFLISLGPLFAKIVPMIGPAVTAIVTALGGLLSWIGTTLIPGLLAFFSGPVGWTVLAVAAVVAMVVLFREPIMKFFTWLGEAISTAFSGLIKLLQPIFVQPFIDLWNKVLRGPVTAMFTWIGSYIQNSMKTALALAYQVFVQPWVTLWDKVLREPVTAGIKWIQDTWKGISKFFTDNVTTPISNAWTTMVELLPKAMNAIGDKVKSIFTGVVNTIKGALRSVLQFIANAVNSVGAQVNKLIGAFNRLPGPDIPMVPTLSVPAFAEGGIVRKPTLALVGEGGEPEYIIPESKMAAASANYLSGSRSATVVSSASGSGASSPTINIQTGPVVEFNGQRYVTVADMERGLQLVASSVLNGLRTPAGRYATGVR